MHLVDCTRLPMGNLDSNEIAKVTSSKCYTCFNPVVVVIACDIVRDAFIYFCRKNVCIVDRSVSFASLPGSTFDNIIHSQDHLCGLGSRHEDLSASVSNSPRFLSACMSPTLPACMSSPMIFRPWAVKGTKLTYQF